MTSVWFRMLERVLLWLVPPTERECVSGDLNEELGGASTSKRVATILGIAIRFHLEPYRSIDRSLALMGLTAFGWGMSWAVLVASNNMFAAIELFSDPLIKTVAMVWSASHVTAAVAVGLIVGRMPLGYEPSGVVRSHVGVVLGVVFVLLLHGIAQTVTALAVLFCTIYLGSKARTVTASEVRSTNV